MSCLPGFELVADPSLSPTRLPAPLQPNPHPLDHRFSPTRLHNFPVHPLCNLVVHRTCSHISLHRKSRSVSVRWSTRRARSLFGARDLGVEHLGSPLPADSYHPELSARWLGTNSASLGAESRSDCWAAHAPEANFLALFAHVVPAQMPAKIAVIYSSTYGHIRTLAEVSRDRPARSVAELTSLAHRPSPPASSREPPP